MKDRTPRYPGRVKLTPVAGQTNTYDMTRADSPIEEGTPINKQTLLTDETAHLLELKQECPTPDDAFAQIGKNFTGDGGMNINLLEEAINMKYCKIIEAEGGTNDAWLAAGAAKCVVDSYTGTYRYYARLVAGTAAFEIKRVHTTTGATLFRSIATSQTITFTKNNSNPTYWVAKIVPVPVRYSHHMIFMYTIGYNYSSSYNGQIGTVCFDTTTNSLISIGQAAVNSSSWPSGSGAYNYLTYNSYGQGCMLANAVRTNSGYIRFWPGYNSNSSGYVYSMAEGGFSFSSYSTHYSSSLSDYSTQACYVALYKNDRAHIARQTVQYLVQFSGTSGSDVSNSSLTGITNYSTMGSLTSADSSGNYTRSLTFSADGLKSYFMFQRNGSPYQMCLWTNSATDAAPVYSELDEGNTGSGHLYNSSSEKWSIALSDNRRYSASAKTLLTEKLSGQYAQSFPFAANCARNCYGYHTIAAADPAPVVYQLPLSAGFVLNSTNDGVIVWNEFGQVWDMKFFDQNVIPYKTWTCPEDGTYKIILVGGGAAGGAAYGGGSGYLMIGTVPLEEGDTVEYFVGKGGVYNAEVPLVAMESSFGTLRAAPGNGRKGGADGASTASGGGGGGYNLVTFGGQGQNYAEGVTAIGKDRNGGQSANSGACTSGDGYGAGGAYCQNGKDGVIVILR